MKGENQQKIKKKSVQGSKGSPFIFHINQLYFKINFTMLLELLRSLTGTYTEPRLPKPGAFTSPASTISF